MQYSTVTLMALAAVTVSAQNFLPPMPAHAERAELVARKGDKAQATSSGVAAKASSSAGTKATKSAAAASSTAKSSKTAAATTTKATATATKSGAAASGTVVTAGAAGSNAGSWVTIAGMGITFALFM